MKRVRPLKVFTKTSVQQQQQRFFPNNLLVMIEEYLNDSDLSSLARCSRMHMILCYQRAKRILGWNTRVYIFSLCHFVFPPDQFLQMQLAKMIIFSPSEPEIGTVINAAEDIVNAVRNTFVESFTRKVSMPFTHDMYMSCICFVDSNIILESITGTGRKLHTVRELLAIDICCKNGYSKCSYAVQVGNYDIYIKYAPTRRSLLDLSIQSCTSPNYDARIIIAEIETRSDDEDKEKFYAAMLPVVQSISDDEHFYFFEHPLLCEYMALRDLTGVYNWFNDVIRAPNGAVRCEKLMHMMKVSSLDILLKFEEEEYSFITECFTESTSFEKHHIMNGICEKEIKALISFSVTRKSALKRVKKYLKMFEKLQNNSYSEDYAILKAILLNNQ